jgi:hypothetical protein
MNRLLAALCGLLLCLCSCINPGSAHVVGFATLSGTGDARSDGNVVAVLGQVDGDVGVFVKGSGFPMTVPIHTNENEAFFQNKALGLQRHQPITDPIPWWARDLYRDEEIIALQELLRVSLTFESQ